MLYREIIALCSETHTEHIDTLCGQKGEILVAFAKLRKATISFVMTACPHATLGSHWKDFRWIWYQSILRTSVENSDFIKIGQETVYYTYVHSVEQKSIGVIFRTSRSGSDVRYSCHHNSSRFSFPLFAHSWCFSVFHSLQSSTPRMY